MSRCGFRVFGGGGGSQSRFYPSSADSNEKATDIYLTSHIPSYNEPLYRCCGEYRKEMFYLTTLSTHFIYGYMATNIC